MSTPRYKILLLDDGLYDKKPWIVGRICQKMKEGINHDITIKSYTQMTPAELVNDSKEFDLIHYGNWDCGRHLDVLGSLKCPLILSIRSHRYESYVKEAVSHCKAVHVVNPMLMLEFPGSYYIPDGIFKENLPYRDFTVGFAGAPSEYKGFDLIEQACKELEVRFMPATQGMYTPKEMYQYYPHIDLMVIASEAEGFNTIAMECMYMNKPFITTRVGIPSALNLPDEYFIDRTIEGIKKGILRHMTNKYCEPFDWKIINKQFEDLYERTIET